MKTITNNRLFTAGVSLLVGLFTACSPLSNVMGGTKMKAERFFEPEMVQLLHSIQKNDMSTANQLIAQGVDLNVLGNEGITPLLWFITQTNDLKATKRALELGADPNFQRPNGDNAITFVARNYAPEWLKMLLAAGGDPNSIDRNGHPALFDAIGGENWHNINTLLEYGADVNLKDRNGSNSALYPAYIMKYEFVYFFLQQGADPFIYSSGGANLAWRVHEVIADGIVAPGNVNYPWVMKIKQYLIEQGVQFPPPSPKEVRAMWDKHGKPSQ
ncbi:ankyrin repeat domain-containing protein [Vibrio sp. MA40-2]|uniref:ankyrin repeat domain-containing protein n=1 Tax=Vibrio sp. MA40-2 TaxID=3391828 RepID=UPI0039A5EC3F